MMVHHYRDPSTIKNHSLEMDPVCSSPTVVSGYGSRFQKVDRQSHKISHTPKFIPLELQPITDERSAFNLGYT